MSLRKIIPYNPDLKEKARKLRQNMTLSEILLWDRLKSKQILGFQFSRQRPIDNYIVDFYCKDLMLAIEVDGDSHDHTEVQEYDHIRQKRLEKLGVRFLRFEDMDIKKNIEDVVEAIELWIEEHQSELVGREPTPAPKRSHPSQEGT